jgi:hypothetical protein
VDDPLRVQASHPGHAPAEDDVNTSRCP